MAALAAPSPDRSGINPSGNMEMGGTTTTEAELRFYNSYSSSSDWNADDQVKPVSIFQVVDGEVLGLEPTNRRKFMSLVPSRVSTIKEAEQKYLCIEYGPEERPQYLYLDFTNSRNGELENLEAAINQTLPGDPFRRRSSSAPQSTLKRTNKTVGRSNRIKSAIQQTNVLENIAEQGAYLPVAKNQLASTTPRNKENEDGPLDALNQEEAPRPAFEWPAPNSQGNAAPENESDPTDSDLSPPGSLHSYEGDNELLVLLRLRSLRSLQVERDQKYVETEINMNDLSSVDICLADYEDAVYVSNLKLRNELADPFHGLYIGDQVLEIDQNQVDNAHDALERIKSCLMETTNQSTTSIKLKLRRFPNGHMCVINHTEKSWLGITLHGSTIMEMVPGAAFRNSCDPGKITLPKGRQVDKAITSINDRPVSLNEEKDEVCEKICVACKEDGPLVFHVHPTIFLKALASREITNRPEASIQNAANLDTNTRENELSWASQEGDTAL